MVILISDFSSEGDLFLFGCFLLFSGGTYNENGCLKKIFECQRPQPSGYNIGNTVCGPSGLTAIILQSGWAWVSLWSLTPGHPGLSVSKEFCLPIFWSRCRAILKFHAEICENTWLNWTVGSDCLLPEYWDSDMFWCIFSSQVNSFSFYFFFFFFFFFFCPNHTLLLYPGSPVHGILQVRILECVAIPFSRGSSRLRDRTWISCISGRFLPSETLGKPII